MATLTLPDLGKTLTEPELIRSYLRERGIWFDQWAAQCAFAPNAGQTEVLAAYAHVLEPFMREGGYQTADVIAVHSETPGLEELRAKFLREHTHSEDEVRFFVDGQGYFWFHLDDCPGVPPEERVFCVKCEAGDLLSVPAGVKHWFDLGPVAFVKAIRIFIDPAGWVPHYTDSALESRYASPVSPTCRVGGPS